MYAYHQDRWEASSPYRLIYGVHHRLSEMLLSIAKDRLTKRQNLPAECTAHNRGIIFYPRRWTFLLVEFRRSPKWSKKIIALEIEAVLIL